MEVVKHSEAFQVAHPYFYEHPLHLSKDTVFHDRIRELVPPEWDVRLHEVWCYAQPPNLQLPMQGFKIHVSAAPWNALAVLEEVAKVCRCNATSFKVLRCSRQLTWMTSKNADRAAAGKFIAIYPMDDASARELLEQLYSVTRSFEGPYILSDRRYKDSRVIYYRYGAFVDMYRIRLTGQRERLIRRPDKSYQVDARVPYFRLPDWVDDLIPQNQLPAQGSAVVLRGRYRIEQALAFSNCGGVYEATDLRTGDSVIVKEARAMTATTLVAGRWIDAIVLLQQERAALDGLSGLAVTPTVIEFFQEWEHAFLVQSRAEGIPMLKFRSLTEWALIPFDGSRSRAKRFCAHFKIIAQNLISALKAVHSRRIVHGDISATNVLIDPASLRVSFIDLGSATVSIRGDSRPLRFGTPGYLRRRRTAQKPPTRHDDYYAMGILLLGLILPVERVYSMSSESKGKFMSRLQEIGRLPAEVGDVINLLCAGKVARALSVLDAWQVLSLNQAKALKVRAPRMDGLHLRRPVQRLSQTIKSDLKGITRFIQSTADIRRDDRLWPCDYEAFGSNPLSIAYGACGPLLFLQEVGSPIESGITKWVADRRLSSDNCPPGLYIGSAGVAFAHLKLGDYDRAESYMHAAFGSRLLATDQTMFYGAAGCGLVALEMYGATGRQLYLDWAVRLGRQIAQSAQTTRDGPLWSNPIDTKLHYGFAFGSAGIALYLLYLFLVTNDESFLKHGNAALETLLIRAQDALAWGRYEGDVVTSPYSLYGSAGVGSVLIRYAHHLDSPAYLSAAQRLASVSFSYFTVTPGQLLGLSGIGEFLLDMWLFTGNTQYRNLALAIADNIDCYGIRQGADGLAFPGRRLERISTDYAHGSAGVGLFFHRLLQPGPRMLHDLCFVRELGQPRVSLQQAAQS